MAFMDNMKNRFSQASQSTVQKAKDLSELARLNGTISDTENRISELYGKIGYDVYCAYRDRPLPEVAGLIGQVTELHQSIEACRAQIKAINAANSCPNCGAKIRQGMAFCSGCGYKLPVVEQPAPSAQAAFCTNCGAPITPGSLFCTSCGKKIE
ncbi:MAG TPA: hypothetical protein DF613_04200 [Lachnospiraceae bacterium]|nr:hypothetical protein [Lachnospiraceae bacterium]